jgi:NifU-like protein involved in Fe-S cluster formation
MWETLYTQDIRDFGHFIPHEGRLMHATVSASRHSTLCGATVHVDLLISGDQIIDFGQEVEACILGRAAAALLGREIVGTPFDELRTLRTSMHHLLTTGLIPILPPKWKDLAVFQAVHPYPLRHGAILLPFDTVNEAIDKHMESLKTNS